MFYLFCLEWHWNAEKVASNASDVAKLDLKVQPFKAIFAFQIISFKHSNYKFQFSENHGQCLSDNFCVLTTLKLCYGQSIYSNTELINLCAFTKGRVWEGAKVAVTDWWAEWVTSGWFKGNKALLKGRFIQKTQIMSSITYIFEGTVWAGLSPNLGWQVKKKDRILGRNEKYLVSKKLHLLICD